MPQMSGKAANMRTIEIEYGAPCQLQNNSKGLIADNIQEDNTYNQGGQTQQRRRGRSAGHRYQAIYNVQPALKQMHHESHDCGAGGEGNDVSDYFHSQQQEQTR